jgi:hypothetical protein
MDPVNPRRTILRLLTLHVALLFSEGRALAASPTTAECLSASEAAIALGNEHKLRASRSSLLICASASCPADIRKECLSGVEETNAQIPTVIFSAKDAGGLDLFSVRVVMDAEVLAERLDGTAISIDPGEHTFAFETAGKPTITKRLLIEQGHKGRREQVTFDAPRNERPRPTLPLTHLDLAAQSGGLGRQRALALAAGGIGLAGVVVGAVFAAKATSENSDSETKCSPVDVTRCSVEGAALRHDARNDANIATAGALVALAGLAGGVALWFTAPRPASPRAYDAPKPRVTRVAAVPGGVAIGGQW